MQAVVLAGGVGSRLWPISTKSHPKPLLKMSDGESLIQKAYLRAKALSFVDGIITVTNSNILSKIKAEYKALENYEDADSRFILEPFPRNTGAAIAAAALHVSDIYGSEEVMLVLPADHLITDQKAFNIAAAEAMSFAESGRIATFGITPDRPEVGFGYIKANGNDVLGFVEKPSREIAQQYIDSGDFYWNSGMFCFKAKIILEEMEKHCPELLEGVRECMKYSLLSKNNLLLNPPKFGSVISKSIDYAVMEKSNKLALVPCNVGWEDIGNWESVGNLEVADESGNRIKGKAILHDVSDCYIESNGLVIGAVGVKNLAIISTKQGFLVVNKEKAADVRNLFSLMPEMV